MTVTLGLANSGTLDGNGLVALALAVIAVFFLMTGLRRRQRQRSQIPPRTTPLREPPSTPDIGTQQRLRRDLEDLIGELQELSRKISAEIDTRFAKLEAAMRDADRRIAVLNRLSRDGREGNGRLSDGDSRTAGDEGPDARYGVVYELADAGHSPVEIARDLGKTPGEIELILNLRKSVQR